MVNPQFASGMGGLSPGVLLDSNASNSSYHSMNLQLTKRLSHGLTNQTSYTWSRSLGDAANDGVLLLYINPRNRSSNKTLLSFHRTHSFRSNGTFELAFGPDRSFLRNGPRRESRQAREN